MLMLKTKKNCMGHSCEGLQEHGYDSVQKFQL